MLTNNNSSSEEEDGDEAWKSAINSAVVASSTAVPLATNDVDHSKPPHSQLPKHYQIKAQKALDNILEKYIVLVKDSDAVSVDEPQENDGGVRLFKQAPVGIVFDHKDESKRQRKKPRIRPGEEIDEKSKKFKKKLKSVVVEGTNIIASAKDARQKSLAKIEAKETAAREKAKREEERVAQLKKTRGERWLPSMAREMQVKAQGR